MKLNRLTSQMNKYFSSLEAEKREIGETYHVEKISRRFESIVHFWLRCDAGRERKDRHLFPTRSEVKTPE